MIKVGNKVIFLKHDRAFKKEELESGLILNNIYNVMAVWDDIITISLNNGDHICVFIEQVDLWEPTNDILQDMLNE